MAGTPQMGGLQQIEQPSGLLHGGAQIGLALAQVPQMLANQQAQQQQQQLNALAIQQKKAQVGQQLYGQMADELIGAPTKAGDPAYLKRAQSISKQTGIPAPIKLDENGNSVIDIEQLRPRPSLATMKPDDQVKLFSSLIALPKEDREAFGKANGISDIPPEWLTADQHIPVSVTMGPALQKQLSSSVDLLSAGKLSPAHFAELVRSNENNYKAVGIDTQGYLTPEFLSSGISQFAQGQMDWTKARIKNFQMTDAIKNKIADNQKAETMLRLQLTGQQLKEHMREFDANQSRLWQTHQDNISTALSRLNLSAASLDERVHNDKVMQSLGVVNALSKPLSNMNAQLTAAQTQLDITGRAIGNITAQGNAVPDILQKQYSDLQDRVNQLLPEVGSYGLLLKTKSAQLQGGIAGVPVRPVAKPAQATTKYEPGKVYQDAAGHRAKYNNDGTWTNL